MKIKFALATVTIIDVNGRSSIYEILPISGELSLSNMIEF